MMGATCFSPSISACPYLRPACLADLFRGAQLFPSGHLLSDRLRTFYFSCFVFTSYVNFRLNRERYHVFLNAIEAKVQQRQAEERGVALLRLSNTDPLTA